MRQTKPDSDSFRTEAQALMRQLRLRRLYYRFATYWFLLNALFGIALVLYGLWLFRQVFRPR
jgi:hypothetical protein